MSEGKRLTRDELFDHLNGVHCWDEWAFEGDGYDYMKTAHAAIHAKDKPGRLLGAGRFKMASHKGPCDPSCGGAGS